MKSSPMNAASKVAARQQGILHREQVKRLDISDGALRTQLDSGRWARLGYGLYVINGTPRLWQGKVVAACLKPGQRAFASHRTAAQLWGLPGGCFDPIEITMQRGASGRSSFARVHRSIELPNVDITKIDNIPVTHPARTLIDLSSVVSTPVLEAAVDQALCTRLVTLDRLCKRLDQLAVSGRPGISKLRKVLQAWSPGRVADSAAEMQLVRQLVKHGLRSPIRQYEIRIGEKLVARVDMAYPKHKVAIEFDGFKFHAGRESFDRDRLRNNSLIALGWKVVHATQADLNQGCERLSQSIRAVL